MIRFCISGTVAAHLDAEIAARDHHPVGLGSDLVERVERLGLLDLGDHARRRAAPLEISLNSRRSAAARTNESATKSTPRSSANSRSSRSFSVSDGIGIGTPGRLTPLFDVDLAADEHAAGAPALSMRSTISRTLPSSISTSLPGLEHFADDRRGDGRSPCPRLAADDARRRLRAPRPAQLADAKLRALEVGDQRDGRLSSACTARMSPARTRVVRVVPCEKFSRAASMPARASARTSRCDEAGPIVATIFVRRGAQKPRF